MSQLKQTKNFQKNSESPNQPPSLVSSLLVRLASLSTLLVVFMLATTLIILQLMPSKVDWSQLSTFEEKDFTIGSQELACAAGDGCEVVDL